MRLLAGRNHGSGWGFSRLLAIICLSVAPVLCALEAQAGPGQGSVTLEWDPTPGDITGYTVYYGAAPLSYTNAVRVGNGPLATISGLENGVTYYFAVTATARSGLESDFSNEVDYTVPGNPPPPTLQVEAVSLEPAPNENTASLLVSWSIGDVTIAGYAIYYGTEPGVYSHLQLVGRDSGIVLLEGLEFGSTYYIQIRAINQDGSEVSASDEVACAIPPAPVNFAAPFTVQVEQALPASGTVRVRVNLLTFPAHVSGWLLCWGSVSEFYDRVLSSDDTSIEDILIDDLSQGVTYYFALKWLYQNGSESSLSDEYIFQAPRLWPRYDLRVRPQPEGVHSGQFMYR